MWSVKHKWYMRLTWRHSSCPVPWSGKACLVFAVGPAPWSDPQSCWASSSPDTGQEKDGADFAADMPGYPVYTCPYQLIHSLMKAYSNLNSKNAEALCSWSAKTKKSSSHPKLQQLVNRVKMYLYGDEQNIQGIGLFRGGQRLSLALQFGHLHPLAIEEGIGAVHLPDCH